MLFSYFYICFNVLHFNFFFKNNISIDKKYYNIKFYLFIIHIICVRLQYLIVNIHIFEFSWFHVIQY